MTKGKNMLFTAAALILGGYFLLKGIILAKPFLAPVVLAMVLALLMLPVSRWLERKMKRGLAAVIIVLFLFALSIGFMALIGLQVQQFIADWDSVQQKLMPHIENARQYLFEKTPLKEEHLKQGAGMQEVGRHIGSFAGGLYSFAGDYLLTLIYVFFMLTYRTKFRHFFLKLFRSESKEKINGILQDSAHIVKDYLYGKFLLMVFLAVLYAIGMGITGVKSFIIISLLSAALTIIPYIGNIIAFVIALGLGYIAEGNDTALVGIVVTFFIAQFVETYFFEPYVVGDKVNLDPFITVLAVVAGNFIWGVMGMVLSIPILAMVNIVVCNVPVLKPYAYLLSNNTQEE